ncbi:MAG TPA: DUF1203 domain-containing protein [Chitinophagales bacterium]|nr:DUF1203 domain-containing protein [Chitinophagales bacterium]
MSRFRIIPITKEYAARIRKTAKDDFGHAVMEEIAKGYGPCRVSLKPFRPGIDKRLLLSHSPFAIDNAFNQTGPVFINALEVEAYQDVHHFPPEIKADKINFPLSLIGYNADQQMVFARLAGNDDVDELIQKVFDQYPEIEFLHARNAEAGCYICRIEKV